MRDVAGEDRLSGVIVQPKRLGSKTELLGRSHIAESLWIYVTGTRLYHHSSTHHNISVCQAQKEAHYRGIWVLDRTYCYACTKFPQLHNSRLYKNKIYYSNYKMKKLRSICFRLFGFRCEATCSNLGQSLVISFVFWWLLVTELKGY